MSHTRARAFFDPERAHWRRSDDVCVVEFDVAGQSPDLLSLAQRDPQRYPFLLESSAGAAAQSRYDMLLAFPGEQVVVDDAQPPGASGFFERLDAYASRHRGAGMADVPYVGGWFVYLGYEMAGCVEPTLALPAVDDPAMPHALAVRCPTAVVHDRRRQRLLVVAETGHRDKLEALVADLNAACARVDDGPLEARWREDEPQRYLDQVAQAKRYIRAGDVFQVNLSRAWHGRLAEAVDAATVYAALRRANPAPFSGLVQWAGGALACSSPERLLEIDAGVAQTRPIAGTRARHAGRDAALKSELMAHPKERAEHIMLIDLERNDLGRVCQAGTVTVDELMVTESYAHVHHIVSNVRGWLRAGVGPGEALRAVFPGGTITGCPKVRCMEIIAELEGRGRGAYTGAIGYLSRCGRLDTNIVIRSLTQSGRDLRLRTGAGIVADSQPAHELDETRAKARGVLRSFVDQSGAPYG